MVHDNITAAAAVAGPAVEPVHTACSRLAVSSSMTRVVGFDTSSVASTPSTSQACSPRNRFLPESPLSQVLRGETPLPMLRVRTGGKPLALKTNRRALSMSSIPISKLEAASPFKPVMRSQSECSALSRSSDPIEIPWKLARTYTPPTQWMPDPDTPPSSRRESCPRQPLVSKQPDLAAKDGVVSTSAVCTDEVDDADRPSTSGSDASAASGASGADEPEDDDGSVALLDVDGDGPGPSGLLEDLFAMDLGGEPPAAAAAPKPAVAAASAAAPPQQQQQAASPTPSAVPPAVALVSSTCC